MNPLLNPFIGIPLIKNYLTDPTRLPRLTPKKLKQYQDKAFKRIVRYAYSVPLYHQKYKAAGIYPSDITGLEDITKLPFITKQDLINNFPNNIIPLQYNRNKAYIVSTGGTTGKPVSIYTDFSTILRALGPVQTQFHYFNLNLRKTRVAHLGNFNRYRIDKVVEDQFLPKVKSFYSLENTLNIDVSTPIKAILEQLNQFKPDLIISYPAIFQHLAFLKKKGAGEHVQPKLMQVGGAILDEYTRSYVEDAFNCPLRNIYLSVEAQGNIAFECHNKHWHIHADFFHLEAIDEAEHLVGPGERGHIVLTRLWGRGTPIIRYTGMDDWVTLDYDQYPLCEFSSPVFTKPVEGRMRANIILPNGKIFPPGAFCFISPVLHDLQTYKVKQFQIIQHKIDEIEILLVIDEDLRNTEPSFEVIAKRIKEIYQQKTSPEVHILVREVSNITPPDKTGKPAPIVISHVDPNEGTKFLE